VVDDFAALLQRYRITTQETPHSLAPDAELLGQLPQADTTRLIGRVKHVSLLPPSWGTCTS
jgi:hypothetical protein